MITLAQITEYIQTLCPIISIDSSGNIVFDQAATQQQKTSATAVIADWLIGVYPPSVVTAATIASNWALVDAYKITLTVIVTSGNKYAANDMARYYISEKINTLLSTDVIVWVEDWGHFNTTKVELQEALTLANSTIQAYIKTTFGV